MIRKKKLNLKLCESIIKTDFFLVQDNNFDNRERIMSGIHFKEHKFVSLKIFTLHKELRQFIRILYFIFSDDNNKYKLFIYIKDPGYKLILENYIKKQDFRNKFYVSNEIRKNGIVDFVFKKNKISKYMLSLEGLSKDQKKLAYNNFLLTVNICFENNVVLKNSLLYRVYNKMNSYKKIYFLIALLECAYVTVEKKKADNRNKRWKKKIY